MFNKPKFTIHRIGKAKKTNENRDKKNVFNKKIKVLKYIGLGVLTIALMGLVYSKEKTGDWFKASILEAPQPFNGTVPPISKVPNWTHWNGDNNTTLYSQIESKDLIDLPEYNLSKMAFPNEDLVWGNASHDVIRNTKITFPVVYMGNYEYDHKENNGSHLAIDIKIPVGTPLHSIANGKVFKTSMQSSGFGHHTVIKHSNVPDPKNPGKLTTIYSCYVHMSDIDVKEGQNVMKGQIIGKSGNTGTSTTPHLHFQIDTDTAPWHPYWPFSSTERQEAGLNFFQAINAGLGKQNGINNTTNPIQYVTNHIGDSIIVSNRPGGTDNPNIEIVEDPHVDTEDLPSNEDTAVEIVEDNKIDSSLFTFKVMGETVSLINNGVTITVIDENNQISKLSSSDRIEIDLSGVGRVSKKQYSKDDFVNNAIKVIVNSSEKGVSNIMIGKNNHKITFIDQVNSIAKLKIEHDGTFKKNVVEIVKIIALDRDGNPTPAVNFSGTISITVKEGRASITPNGLKARDFKNGVATVRVKIPNEERVILRAQNGALIGESESMRLDKGTMFTDVKKTHPNYEAIKYLKDNDIINGYSDGTFKPNGEVNRVEALKMLMIAFDINAGEGNELLFSDADSGAWYAKTLATAVNKGIVKGYEDGSFRPGQIVNKAEYLKILFKTNDIELDAKITANPYADVPKDAWFAPYAYMTNRRNLLNTSSSMLYPANGMTRAEVAETIYRLKYVLDNNLISYSK